MFKFAVAALLATSSFALEQVMSFTKPYEIIHHHNKIHLDALYNFDFGWKGKYDTSFPTKSTIKDYLSLGLFSVAKLKVSLKLFDFYTFDAEFVFIPLEVTPIKA
jgi:hypothetical protein